MTNVKLKKETLESTPALADQLRLDLEEICVKMINFNF